MFRYIQSLFTAKPSEGRSPHWEATRQEWLRVHTKCAACGTDKFLTVHHIKPFHLFPQLELDPTNFITLCESPSHNCHIIWGHFLNWTLWNPNVVVDTTKYYSAFNAARLHLT